MLITVCTCLSLGVLGSAALAQLPSVVLMQNIKEHADFVARYGSYDRLASGGIEFGSHSDVVSEHAGACVKAIRDATAGGVPESKSIEVNFRDGGSRMLSISEVRSLCERLSSVAGKDASLREARQAAINAGYWPSKMSQGQDFSGPNARVAADAANICINAIDKALSSGNQGSTEIQLDNGKMTLSDAREMCVYVRDSANKQVKADAAAEEAQYEPFRKLLSGDKLRVYNNRLKIYKVYTTGGRVLKTPETYRDAAVWCTVGVNRDSIVPVWDLSCWRFRGMTQLGGVINKSGTGEAPPSSAFP